MEFRFIFNNLDEKKAASWFAYIGAEVRPLVLEQASGTARDLFDALLGMTESSDLGTAISEQRRDTDGGETTLAFLARMKGYLDFAASIGVRVSISANKWARMLQADAVTTRLIIKHNGISFKELYTVIQEGQQVTQILQPSRSKVAAAVAAPKDITAEETAAVGGQRRDDRRKCYKCDREGHLARDCPKSVRNQDTSARGGNARGRGARGGYRRQHRAGAVEDDGNEVA